MRHAPKAGVRHLRTVREVLASHVPTLYNVIALLCAAVLLAAGDSFQLSFLPMALLHAALCIGAELCFRRAMRRLEAPEPPVVVLAGEGHETRPGAAVAEGDRLRLDAGSPVPATVPWRRAQCSRTRRCSTGAARTRRLRRGIRCEPGRRSCRARARRT